MTNTETGKESPGNQLARERTQMAAERTDFALIRTGFTVASFGAGMTHIIGREVWPDILVNLLSITFVTAGVMCVQAGLFQLKKWVNAPSDPFGADRLTRRLMIAGSYILQAALITTIILLVFHSF